MLTKEEHKIVADAVELADAKGIEYIKSDLVFFAQEQVKKGHTSVDKILSDFANLGEH